MVVDGINIYKRNYCTPLCTSTSNNSLHLVCESVPIVRVSECHDDGDCWPIIDPLFGQDQARTLPRILYGRDPMIRLKRSEPRLQGFFKDIPWVYEEQEEMEDGSNDRCFGLE